MPEPVRIAFHSFSDIRNPGTYATRNGNQKLKGEIQASAIPRFNFTEWWKIGEGVEMKEPFDVGDELVAGLLHALETVCTLFHLQDLKVTGTTAGSWFKASC